MYEYKAIVTRVIDGDTIDVDIQLGFDVIGFTQPIVDTKTKNLMEVYLTCLNIERFY